MSNVAKVIVPRHLGKLQQMLLDYAPDVDASALPGHVPCLHLVLQLATCRGLLHTKAPADVSQDLKRFGKHESEHQDMNYWANIPAGTVHVRHFRW